ncbi:hypothetical protein Y032_0466g1972 [Ancylostoma ceylanicum]|uniref:Uncharacterized protein n=1 Tax=Ancylostoma ceylanicum TaxID=53326 RepID=A0A016WZ28_9BILA|nr:hypothetical protein Y032_0466g1972 [Ancylostoma ceylanicum]
MWTIGAIVGVEALPSLFLHFRRGSGRASSLRRRGGRVNLVDQARTLIVEISFMLEERFAFFKTNKFRGSFTSVENNSDNSQ